LDIWGRGADVTQLIILLGVNGYLGTSIYQKLPSSNSSNVTDIIGIDKHRRSTLKSVTNYVSCDFKKREHIRKVALSLPLENYEKIILISCIGLLGGQTFCTSRIDEKTFFDSVQVNLLGICHFGIILASACLKAKNSLRIVAIGSTAANVGST
jgi:short-subunit dehydrogenase